MAWQSGASSRGAFGVEDSDTAPAVTPPASRVPKRIFIDRLSPLEALGRRRGLRSHGGSGSQGGGRLPLGHAAVDDARQTFVVTHLDARVRIADPASRFEELVEFVAHQLASLCCVRPCVAGVSKAPSAARDLASARRPKRTRLRTVLTGTPVTSAISEGL